MLFHDLFATNDLIIREIGYLTILFRLDQVLTVAQYPRVQPGVFGQVWFGRLVLYVVNYFALFDQVDAVDRPLLLLEQHGTFEQIDLLQQVNELLELEIGQVPEEIEVLQEFDFVSDVPLLGPTHHVLELFSVHCCQYIAARRCFHGSHTLNIAHQSQLAEAGPRVQIDQMLIHRQERMTVMIHVDWIRLQALHIFLKFLVLLVAYWPFRHLPLSTDPLDSKYTVKLLLGDAHPRPVYIFVVLGDRFKVQMGPLIHRF